MTLRAAQTDECFRQRERLPFAKEPVGRNTLKVRVIYAPSACFAFGGHLFAPEGGALRMIPPVYPYREEEIDHD